MRVLYLVGVAVGVFFLPHLWQVAAVCVAHMGLWFVVGLPPRKLFKQVTKLWLFFVFIAGTYALTTYDPELDTWIDVPLFGWTLEINTSGALAGLVMVLRIVTVVLASQVARAGDPRAIAGGLRKLGVPRIAAISIDTVLALFGDVRGGRGMGGGGGGGGGGRGKGGGRGRGDGTGEGADHPEGFWKSVKRLARGDVAPIVTRVSRQIARAEEHAAQQDLGDKSHLTRDIGVIAGVSLTMLMIKALKVLPSIPFAPGHKGVILIPLYIIAARLTKTRFGATWTGLTMGTVAFLMGDGRYGIFEIAKHIAPGLLIDLLMPVMVAAAARGAAGGAERERRPSVRRPGAVAWSLFGGIVAAGRFATIFVVVLAVQAPAFAFAILLPGLAVHVTFGVLSGYVTYHLVRTLDHIREQTKKDDKEAA